ncbi:MAG: hypothetical protein HY327_02570 [Chloroflexi bacterium]|nr:hypothetical protein [Chloroflexota bacterium]
MSKVARFGSSPVPCDRTAFGAAEAIHRGGTDVSKAFETRTTDGQVTSQIVQLDIHGGAQPLGADLIKEFGQPEDRAFVFGEIDAPADTSDRDLGVTMLALTAQERDGMFAMIARRLDKFIQDFTALFLVGFAVALA